MGNLVVFLHSYCTVLENITSYLFSIFSGALSNPYFTSYPPSIQYALRGSRVLLRWDYNINNFSLISGTWGIRGSINPFITITPTIGVLNSDPSLYGLIEPATLILRKVSSVAASKKYYCQIRLAQTKPAVIYKTLRHEVTVHVVSEYIYYLLLL